jgi:hypothetical protein
MRTLLLIVLFAFTPLIGCDDKAADKEDIRAVWQQLDTCNNAADGNGVVAVFTESSFAANVKLMKVGLDGTPAQVKALPAFDRMEVLRMRLLSNRAEISKLDGRGYVRFATSKGWYVMPSEDRTKDTLPKITFSKSGTEAWANIVSEGKRTGMRLHFVKEGGQWKYDEPEAMVEYSRLLADEARAAGVSENDFIIDVLEEELGRKIPASIWDPMP